MRTLTVAEAYDLVVRVLVAVGLAERHAIATADHLIDCELRGLSYGGLPRALTVAERILTTPTPPRPIRVVKQTPVSASLDGGDTLGYVVGDRATEMVIEICRRSGVAVVGANNTWLTGMYSWYLESITAAGMVGMIAGNAGQLVAPYGGTEARLGTNPIAFGFPSSDGAVIWDTGTASLTYAEVVLAERTGRDLPDGLAFDEHGEATVSPGSALTGALAVWGGHRGSGLSLAVHLLGMLTGSPARSGGVGDLGFLVVAIDPSLFEDGGSYEERVAEFARWIRQTRPQRPGTPVRVPFDRSRQQRRDTARADSIAVEEVVLDGLLAIASGRGVA